MPAFRIHGQNREESNEGTRKAMLEQRVRRVLDRVVELYAQNPNRWTIGRQTNERLAHYEFFRLLFDEFSPAEIREGFTWEYRVGPPEEPTSNRDASIDLVILEANHKWVAVEIEVPNAGKQLRQELVGCVRKLRSAKCRQEMSKGYIVPFMERLGSKPARGQGKDYASVCREAVADAERLITDAPIEILKDGILLR